MLEFSHVSKRFGAVQALADCSFSVTRGRTLGFLGPNGAGKTTALRAVFGLLQPDGGELSWDGRAIGLTERLRFGYMPEERGLYPRMPVGEIEELSHGNQQRAQLAAALVHAPDLLVLDEPFAGLDPVAVSTLAEVLRAEAARGAAVLFSSHQLELVEDICEEVAIIDHGRIVATGDVGALRRRSQRRRIDLQLDGAPAGWLPDIAGVQLIDRRTGDLRLLTDRSVDPEQVLAAAEKTAPVIEFSYGPPSLAELFLELVKR